MRPTQKTLEDNIDALRHQTPRPTVRQIAQTLGVSSYVIRKVIYPLKDGE